MKSKLLIICLLFFCLFGCKTTKEIPVQTTTTTVEKLVPVYIPADSAALVALFGCDSLNNVYLKEISELKTHSVRSSFDLRNNTLTYKIVTVRDTIYVKGKETIVEREVPVRVEVEKEVNKLTGWQNFQIWIGRASLLVFLIVAVIGLIRLKLKL